VGEGIHWIRETNEYIKSKHMKMMHAYNAKLKKLEYLILFKDKTLNGCLFCPTYIIISNHLHD